MPRRMIGAWHSEPEARAERLGGAAATFVVHLLLALALLWGLGTPFPDMAQRALEVFAVPPPRETRLSIPPPVSRDAAERRRAAPEREGAAAPPNLRSEPTPIVAPRPLIPLPLPPPIARADRRPGQRPLRRRGSDTRPGHRRGGFGEDRQRLWRDGGGGGGGRGLGRRTGPRLLRGAIRDSDYPRWAWSAASAAPSAYASRSPRRPRGQLPNPRSAAIASWTAGPAICWRPLPLRPLA